MCVYYERHLLQNRNERAAASLVALLLLLEKLDSGLQTQRASQGAAEFMN